MAEPVVFVVDDDDAVRRALERLLRSVGLAVESYGSAREFLDRPSPDGPACLVLDVRMPGLSGLDLQAELSASGHRMPVIFMSGHGTVPLSVRAMKAGALDFLEKPLDEQELLDAVHRGIERDRKTLEDEARLREVRLRAEALTPRERQVFELVVRGMLNKQIAHELGTSEKTIKVHRARVMHKMQAESLADLVRMAGRLGIEPES